jgi:hypothetical protein
MRASLQRLLSEVFDYAGLFPPAKLDMAPALENYVRYREGSESWIVNRFVCPTVRLKELAERMDRMSVGDIEVAAIGQPSTDRRTWEEALEQDSQEMNVFLERFPNSDIAAFEVKVPSHEEVAACIKDLGGFSDADVFVELPWGPQMADSLAALADTEWMAAKARTGGQSADSYPSARDLAAFIHSCIALDMDFKMTAGLHHPFRKEHEHGFLNVLVATTLALSDDLQATELQTLLEDGQPKSFEFGDEAVQWRDHHAVLHDIDEARDRFIGIGSCSIQEPLQDLRALRLN